MRVNRFEWGQGRPPHCADRILFRLAVLLNFLSGWISIAFIEANETALPVSLHDVVGYRQPRGVGFTKGSDHIPREHQGWRFQRGRGTSVYAIDASVIFWLSRVDRPC